MNRKNLRTAVSKLALCTTVGSAMLLSAGAAVAQDATSDEIIVTAQKREESLAEVPAPISVVGSEQLENLHATQLTDYAAYVPGLNVTSGGTPGQALLTIRGIASIGGGPTVGVYLDDVPVGGSAGHSGSEENPLDLMPYDVERIEVLRGPQGTLYGAGAIGGLLHYVTRRPDLNERSFRVGGEVFGIEGAGDIGNGVRAAANIPLIEDTLAVRLSYFRQDTPGYIDNSTTGQEDENDALQEGGRLSVLWALNPDLDVQFTAMVQNTEAGGSALVGNNASFNPDGTISYEPIEDLTVAHQLPETYDSDLAHYALTVNWDLGGPTFTSATAFEDRDSLGVQDVTTLYGFYIPLFTADAPTAGFVPLFTALSMEKFTQEFRLTSPSEQQLEWVLGVYYTQENSVNNQSFYATDANGVPFAGRTALVDPTSLGLPPGPLLDLGPLNPLAFGGQELEYRELAAFGDLTYRFTDRFDVTVGARVARNEQDYVQPASGPFILLAGIPTLSGGDSEETVTTYMLSPRFHVDDDTMIYFRAASGYRPGGPNLLLDPSVPPAVDADTTWNYELGVKSDVLDGAGFVDISVYRIEWQDIQISSTTPSGVSYAGNAGNAVVNGLEFSGVLTPIEGLQIAGNFSIIDAELTDLDAAADVGTPGDRLPQTPDWTAAATVNYEFPISGTWEANIGGGYRYVGERVTDLSGTLTSQTELPSYSALDLHANFGNQRLTLGFFAKNLTDERGISGLTVLEPRIDSVIIQPRTIGVSLDVEF